MKWKEGSSPAMSFSRILTSMDRGCKRSRTTSNSLDILRDGFREIAAFILRIRNLKR